MLGNSGNTNTKIQKKNSHPYEQKVDVAGSNAAVNGWKCACVPRNIKIIGYVGRTKRKGIGEMSREI